ncbi:MMPL family transporter [Brachybacterium sp. EF45031]|uniref:MMPL family transporter n=1 Tax=Brachybacterium sillae TaxID=2810536 RepID=UPI00217D7C4A|nr:MMPL family transporter [Brachybacterium sillae]MCS6710637.1 MMPL family transporter [Brachybacterium sillae]
MSSTLYRLGRAAAARPWRVIGVWTLIALILGALALGLGGRFEEALEIPGTEAQQGLDTLAVRLPEMSGTSGQMVLTTTDGSPIADHAEEVGAIMGRAAEVEGVVAAPDPFDDLTPGTVSSDGTAIIANVQLEGGLGEFPTTTVPQLEEIVDGVDAPLQAHLGGQLLQATTLPFSIAEVIGLIAAIVILTVTFRAILPAALPVVTALTGIVVAMSAVLALAAGVAIPSVTTTLAIMLGLAVGIDYAMFLVTRHRDGLGDGLEPQEAAARAVATSGSAVIFAGLTVIIALVGLFLTGIPFLTVMGLASAFTVAVAVALAVTLLPALFGLAGKRMRPRARRTHAASPDPGRRGLASRWVRLVTAVPTLTIVLVLVGLGALAVPAKDLRLALPDNGTERPDTRARQTYDLITERFGAGYNGPLLVTADIITSTDPLGTVDDLSSRLEALDGVQEVQLATPNRGADMAVVVVIPTTGPNDPATTQLVDRIRADRPAWEEELGVTDLTVTGQAAAGIDITQKLTAAMLPFVLFVVGLSLVLLTIVFRSLWVPLKATLGFLLSLGAAFGAVSLVFLHGWGNETLNVHVIGPVIAFMPIITMGVLFGLAMDYEVFLVTRMREEYVHGAGAREAVEKGFTASASVVVAAALIMISVFTSFIPESTFMIQPIALALAVGIAVDAFVVRMTLVPAVLALLGDRAWHMPRALDRVLPSVDVEGEGLVGLLEHDRWRRENPGVGIRLEGVRAPGLAPLDARVDEGTVLVLTGDDVSARRTALGLLAGRVLPQGGMVAVADRLSPVDANRLRARTHWVSDPTAAQLERLRPAQLRGRTVLLTGPGDSAQAPELAAALQRALDHGATVVVGGDTGSAAALVDALRELRIPVQTLPVLRHRPADASSPIPIASAEGVRA